MENLNTDENENKEEIIENRKKTEGGENEERLVYR